MDGLVAVDPERPGPHLISDPVRTANIRCPNGPRKTELRRVGKRDGFLFCVERDGCNNVAKRTFVLEYRSSSKTKVRLATLRA